eukprot:scaffold4489_cov26-Tisochrysis_lutea.AAC.2
MKRTLEDTYYFYSSTSPPGAKVYTSPMMTTRDTHLHFKQITRGSLAGEGHRWKSAKGSTVLCCLAPALFWG